jgi:POT family proton-dependent oligopeptide transporter
MVGSLYAEGDPRRDSGFTIFYMGINLGALIGALICGYLGESPEWGWRYGFGAAGVGMVAGLISYVYFRPKYLSGVGLPPSARPDAGAAAKAAHQPLTKNEKDGILALLIVAMFVVFFWAAYEQAGSSMNLFALNNTQRSLFGYEFPASWFQSVNPAMILVMGPAFAWLWTKLAKIGKEPSTVIKMGLGFLLLSAGFVFMVLGGAAAKDGTLVSPMWLTLAYAFNTFGELCLSPVGLSLVTKLAPVRLASLLMGIWFLANFAANLLAGYLAGMAKSIGAGSYFQMLGGQADFYLIFVIEAAIAGALLLALTPYLRKLMHGHG